MPSSQTVQRQRTLGGILGVLVLAVALVYHFFPRMFHVDPDEISARRAQQIGAVPGSLETRPAASAGDAEAVAGPPLTLAPSSVVARRMARPNQALPEQHGEDPPQVRALLERAAKALQAGELTGREGAAALYAQAARMKPDSRRALAGLIEVRNRLLAQAEQDIALGDEGSARELLATLRTLPDSEEAVDQLEHELEVLRQVRPLLTRAAALLQQGHADQPPGNNALQIYRQVLKLDPHNAVAEQGLLQVQRAVLDRALAAVAQNDFASAARALQQAAAIVPDSPQWQDARSRIEDIRRQRVGGLLAQARSALDAGNVALAVQLAAQARAVDPDAPELAAFDESLTNARLYGGYRPGQIFIDRLADLPGQAPAMVVIPAGRFIMGAADDERGHTDAEVPAHQVTIARGFALGRTEVTVGEFRAFVKASGYRPDSERLGGASVYDERSGALREDRQASWRDDYAGHPAADNLPVVNVSWNDAQAYAAWLSQHTGKRYRLPSEAEFEYALRGGTRTRYWWGEGNPTQAVENLTGSGDRSPRGRRWSHAFPHYRDGYWGPAPVMSFATNPFGLYDIDGNVSEWVADCWHDNYLRAPQDGSAWLNPGCTVHVVRGGSWGSSPEQARSAFRQAAAADTRSGRVGFRLMREL
ncbi:formylglycine-generating enzyme family protein [Aerosticca soli]|uniref:formylglycine-generating enzyme family protein n=1 Tax=Aerosticca soli TaxID=2010829 RepID=UPI000F84DD36|nr:formylglycine-generating enzyme family protein [Aerosticca soli]MDI3261235.1 formylglycine-generating enzyme family protein [Fulvimonas sp.]